MQPIVLWEDLTFQDKMGLFSQWSIISILANIVQLFGALSNLISVFNLFELETPTSGGGVELLIGFGCMCAWVGLVRYMETSKNYSLLAHTLSLALPNVLRTLLSALPVLLGYTFLGVAIFWKSNRFASAPGCFSTLYSLMFGDMVYDTFHDLMQTNYLAAQMYLYSFIFFSVCVINSLFISVIVDSFNTSRKLVEEKQTKKNSLEKGFQQALAGIEALKVELDKDPAKPEL